MMDQQDKEATRRRYIDRLKTFGYDPRTLGWNKGRQFLRFEMLLSAWPDSVASVLDVGCGFGDMYRYCGASGRAHWRYTGIDIVADLIAEGRRRYPDADLRVHDMDEAPLPSDYDLIVASGLFSHRLTDNPAFVAQAFERFYSACRVGFAVNFMSTSAEIRYDNLYYMDPGSALELAGHFSRRTSIRHDYMPFEFTLYVFRNDAFAPDLAVFQEHAGSIVDTES